MEDRNRSGSSLTPRRPAPRNEYERDHPAVEVIALFDGAIIDARHYDDPGCGVMRRSTTWQLAGGATALGVALVLFVVAFARGGGVGLDVAAVLLVAGGLTAMVRGLFARQEDARPRHFTIGKGAGALLPVDAAPLVDPVFPLLRSTGKGYELMVADGLDGQVTALGRTLPLSEAARVWDESAVVAGARAIPFVDGMRARVDIGKTTVHLKSVPAPRRQPVPLRLDFASHRYTGGVFAAAAMFLAMVFAIPPDASALSLDAFSRHRYVNVTIAPAQVEEPKVPAWLAKKPEPKSDRAGRAHKGATGDMGKKTAPDARKRFAIKGPPDNQHITLAKDQARALATDAGMLGVLRSAQPAISSIFSNENPLGRDADHVMGNLVGTQIGESYCVGCGGQGLVGNGRGGGGDGIGTIGFGKLGRIGIGNCVGDKCDEGYGSTSKVGKLRTHGVAKVPDIAIGTPVVLGGLDKEIIRRVIRRHMNEVKFCYDQALVRNPSLYGKVVVKFTIVPTGAVAAATPSDSTVGLEVGHCVINAVRRIEFPRPMGGGIVNVSYPFAFRAAAVAD